jgi:hypothetical protein
MFLKTLRSPFTPPLFTIITWFFFSKSPAFFDYFVLCFSRFRVEWPTEKLSRSPFPLKVCRLVSYVSREGRHLGALIFSSLSGGQVIIEYDTNSACLSGGGAALELQESQAPVDSSD